MNTTTLYSTEEAATRTGLHPHLIQRWQAAGAIEATRPTRGTGFCAGWSPRDVMIIEAIGRVRRDLTHLGLDCPYATVARLWTDLTMWGEALLYTATVSITVRLGSED